MTNAIKLMHERLELARFHKSNGRPDYAFQAVVDVLALLTAYATELEQARQTLQSSVEQGAALPRTPARASGGDAPEPEIAPVRRPRAKSIAPVDALALGDP
jgi:hypothetical protein